MKFFTKSLIILLLLTLNSICVNAQVRGTLRGLVSDSTSGEALPYGNALVQELGIGASTDANGFFIIPQIPANRSYTLLVSYVGYSTKTLKFVCATGKSNTYGYSSFTLGC